MSTPEPLPAQRLTPVAELAGLGWYVRSLAPRDVHRGVLTKGRVRGVCGMEFFPQRDPALGQVRCVRLPQLGQVCPACLAQANGQVVVSSTAMTVGEVELRDAALGATRRAWPVTLGTYLGSDRRWHGREEARMLGPIWDTWRDAPVTDPAHAQEIWSRQPYGVLLVCGRGVDVLELPHWVFGLLPAPAVPQVPLAATAAPPRRWLLVTATGSGALSGELASVGVRLRTADEVQHGLLTLLLRSGLSTGADDDKD